MDKLTKEQYKAAFKVASRNAFSREDAEDFLQEAYLTVFSKPSSNIKYLNKYIYNAIADHITAFKMQKRKGIHVPLEAARGVATTVDIYDIVLTNRIVALVQGFIASPEFSAMTRMQQLIIKCSLTGERPPADNLTNNRIYAFKNLTGFLAQQGAI